MSTTVTHKIFIVLAVLVISSTSFALGYLLAKGESRSPILIEKCSTLR